MSNPDDSLRYEREGSTVVLTMNRPERRNALSMDMIVRMADAWEAIDADDTIRAVILTGAEGAYCVGGDLASGWMAGQPSRRADGERAARGERPDADRSRAAAAPVVAHADHRGGQRRLHGRWMRDAPADRHPNR